MPLPGGAEALRHVSRGASRVGDEDVGLELAFEGFSDCGAFQRFEVWAPNLGRYPLLSCLVEVRIRAHTLFSVV